MINATVNDSKKYKKNTNDELGATTKQKIIY